MMKTSVLLFLISFLFFVKCEVSFPLLHTNDLHAKFAAVNEHFNECKLEEKQYGSCFGGFPRLAHVIRTFRNQTKNGGTREVIYLDAGDVFTGSNWFFVHRAKIAAEFMNILQPNASALGNHDFNYGLNELENYIDEITSPIVASNVEFLDLFRFHRVQKSIVLNLNGTRVGIIGYTTTEFRHSNVTFYDEVAAIKSETERLHKEGVKILIALGHSGFEMDKRIAYYVPLIDIVVGGHSHTFLYTGEEPSTEYAKDFYPKVIIQPNHRRVLVVQAFAFTKYLGLLNLTFNDEGDLIKYSGKPMLMSQDIPEDKDVLELFEKYKPSIDALKTTVVGQTKVYLDADGEICKIKECNFGNFVADALVAYVSSKKVFRIQENTPVGLINGGAIRQSLKTNKKGNITRNDLLLALPFDSTVVTCSIEGAELLKTLERNLEFGKPKCRGEFFQISGFRVVYDLYGPPRHRVLSARVRCENCESGYEDIEPNKMYNLVSIDWLVDNRCNYIINCSNRLSTQKTLHEIVIWYLRDGKPVSTGLEGRIRIVNPRENKPAFVY